MTDARREVVVRELRFLERRLAAWPVPVAEVGGDAHDVAQRTRDREASHAAHEGVLRRARGTGRAWKRPHGGWAIEYPRGDGTQAHESVAVALGKPPSQVTEREAHRLLTHRLAEVATGEAISHEHARLTVRALIDTYLANLTLRRGEKGERAKAGWRPSVVMAAPLYHHRAAQLTGPMLDDWMLDLQKDGYAPATINTAVALLSAAFRYGLRARLVKRAPPFTRLRLDNARQGFFEPGEVDALLAHLGDPYADLVRCAHLSGWRRGELVSLEWAWVDRAGGVLTLPDSKNGEGRTIPLRGEDGLWNDLGDLLDRRWKARGLGDRAVFMATGRKGRRYPATTGMLCHAWRAACQAAGLWLAADADYPTGRPTKLLHDLRRTAARDMVRAGVGESVAMSITGHKSRGMFTRYNITDERDRSRALAAVAAYRAGGER